MIKAITLLIIASAVLWLVLPAAAQFEIDPDHFDRPATNVAQPHPKESKGSMRITRPYKQVQRHRVQRQGAADPLVRGTSGGRRQTGKRGYARQANIVDPKSKTSTNN